MVSENAQGITVPRPLGSSGPGPETRVPLGSVSQGTLFRSPFAFASGVDALRKFRLRLCTAPHSSIWDFLSQESRREEESEVEPPL